MASQAPTEQINALLAQVKALGSSLNVAERATVQKALLTTLQHIETPYEHLLRLSCSVSVSSRLALFHLASCNDWADRALTAPATCLRPFRR